MAVCQELLPDIKDLSINNPTIGDKLMLFGDEASPPVRFVLMTASLLKAEVEFREVDLFTEENKSEDYKNFSDHWPSSSVRSSVRSTSLVEPINPLQKVPALVMQDAILIDSHAISLYLCRKWDAKHKLYPEDDLRKAKVDEILFFNSTTLFPLDSEIFSKYFAGCPADLEVLRHWYRALDFLEKRLDDQPFLAGDSMTICDLCIVATITSMMCIAPLANHHVQLKQWLSEFEDQPFFKINNRGIKRLMKHVKAANNKVFDVGL